MVRLAEPRSTVPSTWTGSVVLAPLMVRDPVGAVNEAHSKALGELVRVRPPPPPNGAVMLSARTAPSAPDGRLKTMSDLVPEFAIGAMFEYSIVVASARRAPE